MARRMVTAGLLDKLLQDCATATEACGSCRIGPVVEIRPDASGCNWKISVIQGAHSGKCLLAMGEFIAGLRAEFLLDCTDDMDPTLLTTWATQ